MLLIDHLEVGGAQRHVALLADRMVTAGHVVVVGYAGRADVELSEGVQSVQLLERRVARAESRELASRAVELARRFRPTVLHAHLFATALAGVEVTCRLGVPLILSHHSHGTWQDEIDKARIRRALKFTAHNFAASPQILRALVEAGVEPSSIEFLPNAIEIPDRAPERDPHDGPLRIGFLGRYSADKDPMLALEALARMRQRGSDARLEMRGGGELDPEIRRRAEELGLAGAVVVGGPADDADSFLGAVDVLCLSSRSEGMPLVVMEAMARALPVVATRVGAVPQQVEHGISGLIVPPGRPDLLAEALEWMESHPEERVAMGTEGRRRLSASFSVDDMVAQVVSAYNRFARASEPAAAVEP
jgi:glycosyltransferase involved in cell wall biosynthesis